MNEIDASDASWAAPRDFKALGAVFYRTNPSPCVRCGLNMAEHPGDLDDNAHLYEFVAGEEPQWVRFE